MKIAILYSGLPICNESILLSHKKYIWDLYDTDLYLSTYSQSAFDQDIIDQLCNFTSFKTIHIENFDTVYANCLSSIEQNIHIKKDETKTINTLSMFYKISSCFSLVPDSYDILIRHRLDVTVDEPLTLYNNDGVNVPRGGDHHGGLLDLFAFGSYTSMSVYCRLFNHLHHYIHNLSCVFHPESLLRFHCNYHQLPIHRFNYNLYLRGQLFNTTAPCVE